MTPRVAVPRRRTDVVERRGQLLDGAIRAIRRVGADASMADIAAEAGVAKPMLYEYFGDKSGLATALADHFLGDLDQRLGEVLDASSELRPAIAAGIAMFVAFAGREPELFRFLIEGSPGTGREMVELPMLPGLAERLAGFLVARSGPIDVGRGETWAFAVLGMVFSATGWWLDGKTRTGDELVEDLTELICGGLDRHAG